MNIKMPFREIGLSIRLLHNRSHGLDPNLAAGNAQNRNQVLGGVIE
ncbi:MAG: hypothetical protein ACE14P_09375 [Methanotrichaceae archaeon]